MLDLLYNIPGSKKPRKRVGRGIGSGSGKTCGRGHKGQKSRSGVAIKNTGEQTQLFKKLPKRGFNSRNKIFYKLISLEDINFLIDEKKIEVSKIIDKSTLKGLNIIKNNNVKVKILNSTSEFNHKIKISVDAVSGKAKDKISKAGGEILVV